MQSLKHATTKAGAAAALLFALHAVAAPSAFAENELEIGGFGGVHLFSDNNEIGVFDEDDANSPGNSFILGFRIGYAVIPIFDIEGEIGFLPAKAREGNVELLALAYRLQGVFHLKDKSEKLRPFGLLGIGAMTLSPENDSFEGDTDFVPHLGLGVKYRYGDAWGIRADARFLAPPSSASDSLTADFEVMVGLYGTFPSSKKVEPEPEPEPVDTDGDGLVGDADQCPDVAEDKDGFQDEDGCRDDDNDNDGIPDAPEAKDKCPMEPETANGYKDDDGCPETDQDGDGVFDDADQCVSVAEDKDGFEDEDGCPEADNDKDGVVDASDNCPNEAGPVENRGCPDTDRDGDGVVDRLDNCPDEAGDAKNQGCQKKQLVVITPTQIQILDKVFFGYNRATIQRRSNRLLNNVASVLKAHPEIKKVQVEGHTDDRGRDEYNLKLSQDRANAVVQYLVKQGVEPERLIGKGLGETKPLEPNNTARGRAANRRVEFNIVDPAPIAPAAPEGAQPDAAQPDAAQPPAQPPAQP